MASSVIAARERLFSRPATQKPDCHTPTRPWQPVGNMNALGDTYGRIVPLIRASAAREYNACRSSEWRWQDGIINHDADAHDGQRYF